MRNIKDYQISRNFILFLFLFTGFTQTSAYALDKDSFFYLLDGQFLGGYSRTSGVSGTTSTDDQWSVSPNLTLIKDVLTWVNLYSGSYNHSSQVIAQEEGGQLTESTQTHSLSTALKYNVNKSWSIRPLFFTDWVFVNEAKGETFGNGLYDYIDVGGGIESTWKTLETKTQLDQVIAGFRYFDRKYPNYLSLISQFDPRSQVQEDHEKDFAGYKFNLSFESQTRADWSWGAEGIFIYKDFADKRTINSDGIRSQNDTRQDFLEYLNLYFAHPLFPGWTLRVDGQFGYNSSNLDFYDTHNTTSLTDDDFLPNYFDYYSWMLKPSLTYQKEIAKDKNLGISISYAYSPQYYPGRRVQNTVGVYQADDELDQTHTFSAQFSYPLTKYVSWVTVGTYTIANSNQKYEAFYLYSYDSWSAVTGFSFKY